MVAVVPAGKEPVPDDTVISCPGNNPEVVVTPIMLPFAVTTDAPPDKAVVGAVDTENCVPLMMFVMYVLGAKAPMPAVTDTTMPG